VQVKDAEQEAAKTDAVFPCILKILPTCVFNTKDPIVLGVDVVEGIAKVRYHPPSSFDACTYIS
jgi:translation initiation factor 5B